MIQVANGTALGDMVWLSATMTRILLFSAGQGICDNYLDGDVQLVMRIQILVCEEQRHRPLEIDFIFLPIVL